MTSHEAQGSDRRQSKRYDYFGNVTILSADTGATQSGLLVNLSMGGCLLKLKSPEEQMQLPRLETDATSSGASDGFKVDSIVEALFQVGYLPFLATGTVRRCDEDGSLLGIAFQGLSKWGRGDLQNLFSNLEVQPN
jgi:PilZ domain